MNKIFSSIALLSVAALIFTGCAGEEDDIFDDTAINRLDKAEVTYTGRLQAATAGWAMEYYPQNVTTTPEGLGYLMLTKFNKDMSVDVAMNNVYSSNAFKEDNSAWQVIGDNGPVLTFNTYNSCLHTFSDPGDIPGTEANETGTGFGGDYEFVIIDAPENGDYVTLKGKKTDVYVRLTKLDEGTDFKTYLDDVKAFSAKMFPITAPNFVKLHLGDSIQIAKNMYSGMPGLYPEKGDSVLDKTYHPYLITKRGGKYYLRFRDEMTAPDGKKVQELVYDEKADKFTSVDNAEITLEGDNPLSFFKEAMNNGNRWEYNRNLAADDARKALLEQVRKEFSALPTKVTLNYLTFIVQNKQLLLRVNYKPRSSGAANLNYKFTMADSDKGIKLTYGGPNDTAAQNYLNAISTLSKLLETFNGDYTVSAGTSNFNLSTIKVSADDNNWFTIQYK